MNKIFIVLLLTLTLPTLAQIQSKEIDAWDGANRFVKSGVALNPKNVLNIIACAAPNQVYYSFDSGSNWKKSIINSSYGKQTEPFLIADAKGDFYYFYLVGENREQIVCHISKDGGKTWDEGNLVTSNVGKNLSNICASIDGKENIYLTWSQFDKDGSEDANCFSNIQLSKSANGKKWSKPVEISQTTGHCINDANSNNGGAPAASTDGKIYISWTNQNKIFLDRSFNSGDVWLSNDISMLKMGKENQKKSKREEYIEKPLLVADRSKGVYRGCLYSVWADQRNGEGTSDIWFARSANFGDNWTTPLQINKETEVDNVHFTPAMALDQTTGYMYVMHFDRKDSTDNRTNVYLSYSTDGGGSFLNVKITALPSTDAGHGSISVHNGIIVLVWLTQELKTHVWTSTVTAEALAKQYKDQTKAK